MKHGLSDLCFALEPRDEIRVMSELRTQGLDHEGRAITQSSRLEDDPGPPYSDAPADPIHTGKQGTS
jgi:hypothetical protein